MPTSRLVHVIDDDDALRDSLRFLLTSAKIDVKTYESATTFLAALPEIKGGCIITDVKMPQLSGIELLRRLKSMSIDLPVIVMTGHGDISIAVEAMKEGAVDFLEKPYDDEILLQAVRSALDRYGKEANKLVEKAQIRDKFNSLSRREREVLEGLIAGHPNKIIASNLKISPRTVEIYRAHVMTKMNADNISDLVRMSLTAGLFESNWTKFD
jgi:two-component system, LuxR family, response regulator FixJ